MDYGDERSGARKRRQSYVKHTMEYPEGTMLARKCTLAGEIIGKWVKGFRFKPYKGPISANPFKIPEQDNENVKVLTRHTREISSATRKTLGPELADK